MGSAKAHWRAKAKGLCVRVWVCVCVGESDWIRPCCYEAVREQCYRFSSIDSSGTNDP
jgi:hypothetical protein